MTSSGLAGALPNLSSMFPKLEYLCAHFAFFGFNFCSFVSMIRHLVSNNIAGTVPTWIGELNLSHLSAADPFPPCLL